jgi:hypothetical protein
MTITELGGEVVEREIEGVGLLRFENFGVGEWLTQKGEPAKKARRRYLLNGQELDSVSSVVGLLSKEALYYWHEDHGARGAIEAMEAGELEGVPIEEAIKTIRALKLGAKAAKEEGADRGIAIHEAFQTLAATGEAPRFGDFPQAWWPWVKGCAKAWLKLDPEPIDAEFMVCNPEAGYAGRPDLYCRSKGQRVLVDYKTGKGRIYEQAHYQTRGYAEAFEPCHIDPPDRILIVGIGDDGSVILEDCAATSEDWSALLHTYHSRKRVNAAMALATKEAKAEA